MKKLIVSFVPAFVFLTVVSGALHARRRKAPVIDKPVVEAVAKPVEQKKDSAPQAIELRGTTEVKANSRRSAVISLVEKAATYLEKNTKEKAFFAFTHEQEFKQGELYLFVITQKGRFLAHGQQYDLLWKNMWDAEDAYGALFVQDMIHTAMKSNKGWVTYSWRNATKVSYVQRVDKGGQSYTVGAGYYPHSKADTVVNLVKGAVSGFKSSVEKDVLIENIFSILSYPLGRFVKGDLYLYALDEKATLVAQADRPGLIGANSWSYQDATGKFVNQEIINGLKDKPLGEGVWINYISKNAPKKAYAERVVDKKGKSYFIACGYYPDADRKQAVNLVRKGYQFMKTSGESAAADLFSSKRIRTYRYGDLFLFVYDLKGKCIAHGGNPEFVGKNRWNVKGEDGRYFVQEMIGQAKKGGGWLDFKRKNAFASVYVEPLDLGIRKYVIGSGLYPVSKNETMLLLVKSGLSYLKSNDDAGVFSEFVDKKGKFVRGDLMLFTLDQEGLCYAYGDEFDLIWRNLLNRKDDNGKSYIKTVINTARRGSGKTSFMLNGVKQIVYVEPLEKGNKTYIVGSTYSV